VLKEDLPITSNDEIGSLTAAFNKMRVDLDQSQAALQSAHDKMAIELERAAAYVRSILPEKVDDDGSSIRTNWRYIASSQLGGDLLGYHELDERLTAIYLLDVSGHGVGSSLLAVSAHDTLRRRTLPGTRFERPAEVLAGLNDAFPMHQNSGKFFTIWYGVYDSATRELRYSAAGHHPAVLIESKPDGSDRALQLGEPNLMIGAFPEAEYQDETLQIPPGSRLYLFSDGAYEIRDASREMLDYEGLERIITGVEAGSSAGRLDEILGALRAYQGRDEFVDDYSMLEVTFG
jgi:sigma-B regulation protein RsbU (phosphoserine phosphatase)